MNPNRHDSINYQYEYSDEVHEEMLWRRRNAKRRAARREREYRRIRRKISGLIFVVVSMLLFVFPLAAPAGHNDNESDKMEEITYTTDTSLKPQSMLRSRFPMSVDNTNAMMDIVIEAAAFEPVLAKKAVAQAVRNYCEHENTSVAAYHASLNMDKQQLPQQEYHDAYDAVSYVIEGYCAVKYNVSFFARVGSERDCLYAEQYVFICRIGNLCFYDFYPEV